VRREECLQWQWETKAPPRSTRSHKGLHATRFFLLSASRLLWNAANQDLESLAWLLITPCVSPAVALRLRRKYFFGIPKPMPPRRLFFRPAPLSGNPWDHITFPLCPYHQHDINMLIQHYTGYRRSVLSPQPCLSPFTS
jgi:hypothetical protein